MRRRDPAGKRAAVIDAASTLFQADGFEATSAAAIASTAGVSEGIVFHYFGSKHGVLEACSNAAAADFAGVEIKAHRDGIDYHRLVTQTFEWLAEDRMIRRLWSEGDDRIVGALRRGWREASCRRSRQSAGTNPAPTPRCSGSTATASPRTARPTT